MKRRHFLQLFYAIIILLGGISIVRFFGKDVDEDDLGPLSLEKICSRDEIMAIGRTYQQISGENTSDTLIQLLANTRSTQEYEEMSDMISWDFDNGNTVMINGWLLSTTEARRCALMSLQESPNN